MILKRQEQDCHRQTLVPLYSFLGANGFLWLWIGEVSIKVMAATVCVRAHLVPLYCQLSV